MIVLVEPETKAIGIAPVFVIAARKLMRCDCASNCTEVCDKSREFEVGVRFVGSAGCLEAGSNRSDDELHVQVPRANQPSLSLDNSHPLRHHTAITITNGAMELSNRINPLGP